MSALTNPTTYFFEYFRGGRGGGGFTKCKLKYEQKNEKNRPKRKKRKTIFVCFVWYQSAFATPNLLLWSRGWSRIVWTAQALPCDFRFLSGIFPVSFFKLKKTRFFINSSLFSTNLKITSLVLLTTKAKSKEIILNLLKMMRLYDSSFPLQDTWLQKVSYVGP